MIRVGVLGARGRMGRTVCAAVTSDPDCELVAAVDTETGDVIFAPNGKRVVTSTREGTIHAWDAATGRLLDHWERQGALAFMPDSQILVVPSVSVGKLRRAVLNAGPSDQLSVPGS